jgi:hypothetical protein
LVEFVLNVFCDFHKFRGFFCSFRFCTWIQLHLGKFFSSKCSLFVTLGNFMTWKSNVCHVFSNINGSLISFNFLHRLWASVNKRHLSYLWWKKLRQYTHWELVETNVWHTTLKMKVFFFLLNDKNEFWSFQQPSLVLGLTPFWQSSCLNLAKP